MTKTYLGDGVYADFVGDMITLTTEDGVSTTNTIHLELEVYAALQAHILRLQNLRSSMPSVGDVLEVPWEGTMRLRVVEQLGTHPPYVDCLMVHGIHHWFHLQECRVPDINNFLEQPFEADQECPNCRGTLRQLGNDVYMCHGKCGAFFHGPCQHPNRNFNGGCDDCGDPCF